MLIWGAHGELGYVLGRERGAGKEVAGSVGQERGGRGVPGKWKLLWGRVPE